VVFAVNPSIKTVLFLVAVYFVENNLSPTGLGEPGLPPAGGAINAAFGKRMYRQPFVNELKKSRLIG
jgi:isoquinoline 1-oxidoreductase beta subunit